MHTLIFQKRGFSIKAEHFQNVILKHGSHLNNGAHFIGHFKNGQAVGHFWIGLVNNGFLHGMVNENG